VAWPTVVVERGWLALTLRRGEPGRRRAEGNGVHVGFAAAIHLPIA